MGWEFEPESMSEDPREEDLRQSVSSALVRMSKRTGGWAYESRSLNYIDTTQGGTLAGQWTVPLLLNGLVSGTGASQRVGREIRMYSCKMRIASTISSGNVQPIRYVLVYDHQSNGAAPAITDIFETDNFYSEINWSNRDRFDIIYDITLPINGDLHVEEYLHLDCLTVYNSGSLGTVADIATGALYFMGNDLTTGTNYRVAVRIEYEE